MFLASNFKHKAIILQKNLFQISLWHETYRILFNFFTTLKNLRKNIKKHSCETNKSLTSF